MSESIKMTDWEFKPGDFPMLEANVKNNFGRTYAAEAANYRLEEWLATAMVVYTVNSLYNMDSFTVRKTTTTEGYKALLIKIEPIDNEIICTHTNGSIQWSMDGSFEKAICLKCGQDITDMFVKKRCEHQKEKVKMAHKQASARFGDLNVIWKCECGTEVKPRAFEEC